MNPMLLIGLQVVTALFIGCYLTTWLSRIRIHVTLKDLLVQGGQGRHGPEGDYTDLYLLNKQISGWTIEGGWLEDLENRLLVRSGLRQRFPWINIQVVLGFELALACLTGVSVYWGTGVWMIAVIATLISTAFPPMMIGILAFLRAQRLRMELADFLAVLHRGVCVKADVLYAFEQSLDSGLKDPLRSLIHAFVVQVKRGMPVEDALELLTYYVDQPHFRTAMLSIRQTLVYRGDVVTMLENLSWEAFRLEDEYNRRRISTLKDRFLLLGVSLGCLLAVGGYMALNGRVKAFYFQTPLGTTIAVVAGVAFLLGLVIAMQMGRFKY